MPGSRARTGGKQSEFRQARDFSARGTALADGAGRPVPCLDERRRVPRASPADGRRLHLDVPAAAGRHAAPGRARAWRSEEHTSELQSLMRISYAVFCLKKKKTTHA